MPTGQLPKIHSCIHGCYFIDYTVTAKSKSTARIIVNFTIITAEAQFI